MDKKTKDKAVTANLKALQALLSDAITCVSEATEYMAHGNRNAAIGSMPGVGESLEQALALYRAAIPLHRAGRGIMTKTLPFNPPSFASFSVLPPKSPQHNSERSPPPQHTS